MTASGNPSGMATTITVIARMKKLRSYGKSVDVFQDRDTPFSIANLISSIINMTIAEYNPNLPIS